MVDIVLFCGIIQGSGEEMGFLIRKTKAVSRVGNITYFPSDTRKLPFLVGDGYELLEMGLFQARLRGERYG